MSGTEGVKGFEGIRCQRFSKSVKAPDFQGLRVNGSQGLNGFKGPQKFKGLRVPGFEGSPMLTGALNSLAFPKYKG